MEKTKEWSPETTTALNFLCAQDTKIEVLTETIEELVQCFGHPYQGEDKGCKVCDLSEQHIIHRMDP